MQKKEKLYYLDNARGIAICFVVLGHVDGGDHPLNIWISTFLLPMFLIISGVLLRYHDLWKSEKTSTVIWNRTKRLLIPYFEYSGLFIVYGLFMRIVFREGSFSDVFETIKTTVFLQGAGALWFLPTLLFAEIVVILLAKHENKLKLRFAVMVMTSFAGLYFLKDNEADYYDWWYYTGIKIVKTIISAVFILIGYSYYQHKEFIFRKLGKAKIWLSAAVLIANMFLAQLSPHWIDLNFCDISYLSLYYFLATGSTVSLLILLEVTKLRSVPLEFLGKGSLIIMGTHSTLPILETIQNLYLKLPFPNLRYLDDIIITALIIGIETVIILVVNYFKRQYIQADKRK